MYIILSKNFPFWLRKKIFSNKFIFINIISYILYKIFTKIRENFRILKSFNHKFYIIKCLN